MSNNTAFQGSVPKHYDDLMGPTMFEPYGVDVVKRIGFHPGVQILETGAGTGRATYHLANKLPDDGRLVVTDLNEDMLAIAKTRVTKPGLEFQAIDAQALPYPDESFDYVVCLFTMMFFPDKATAAREAHRVLKPGGKFIYYVWGSMDVNPHAAVLHEFVGREFPSDPPQFLNTPFGFYGEAQNREVAEGAGFSSVSFEPVPVTMEMPSPEIPIRGLTMGSPLAAQLMERGGDLASISNRAGEVFASRLGENQAQCQIEAIAVTCVK